MKRRRRWLRDEVLAPWITVGVIVGLWWLGASVVTPDMVRPAAAPASASRAADGSAAAWVERHRAADATADRDVPARDDVARASATADGDIADLTARRLLVPVSGVDAATLRSTFGDARGQGRRHEAMDILAPRGTPVVATVDGRIAKLFTSAAGGLTIYQYDDDAEFCYYYAHLDSYAANLTEGHRVRRGETIGYVGTTGNAPPGTPHLHFAIFRLNAEKTWWDGEPIDPFLVLR